MLFHVKRRGGGGGGGGGWVEVVFGTLANFSFVQPISGGLLNTVEIVD